MRYIATAFDFSKRYPVPLMSLVIDKSAKFYTFYLKGSKRKIIDIQNDVLEFKQLFNEQCMVNDFKSHIKAFNLDKHVLYNVFDSAIDISRSEDIKKSLVDYIRLLSSTEPMVWMKLRANASIVYQHLEDVGVKFFGVLKYPQYNLGTYTGRSSTEGFNIQGSTDKDQIRSIYDDKYFLHLDWIAADLRMAALMSGDDVMISSFNQSDPYSYISSELKEFSRSELKSTFLKSFYSLDFKNPIFELFPRFRSFCYDRLKKLELDGYLSSILKRRFYVGGDRSKLSVFNSQFQGSVVHLMQSSLIKIFRENPKCMITEMHDSIIASGSKQSMPHLLKVLSNIMYEPISGIIMPIKISIGTEWKKWKKVKEKRCEA